MSNGKCKGLAKGYCALNKLNQQYKQHLRERSISRQSPINLETKDNWLNMWIGNCDRNQIIHAQKILS